MKQIGYLLQGILAHISLWIFRFLPVEVSSAIGGFIGRHILSHTNWTKIAENNLKLVYPSMSKKERREIIRKMWNNIGRIAGEYVHLDKIVEDSGINDTSKMVNIVGAENVEPLLKEGKSILFVSGHLGNWEIVRAFQEVFKKDIGCIYREPNNPYVRKLLANMRKDNKYILYPKGHDGIMKMSRDIKKGTHIGLLIDQWLSNSMPTEFLGQETLAADIYAKFAKKYGSKVVPVRFRRIDGKCKFEMIFDKEIQISPDAEEKDIVTEVNAKLTEYINDEPENWLWIHNRFKKISARKRH